MALLEDLAPAKMTDTGMWIWAGILTAITLALSFAAAIWWQRWRARSRKQES